MDGRTWEAKLLHEVRRDLIAHCGEAPSATQRALIDRATWLTLYVARIDRRTAEGGSMTEHDSRVYLAWSNSLARTLAKIGLKGSVHEETMSPLDYVASRKAHAA
jgi:hypothetical protein